MRDARGLTLVEVLASAALFGFVAAAGAAVVASAVRLTAGAKRWSEVEHHARLAVERVVVLLRSAGYGAGGVTLTVADRSQVEFLADFDGVAGPEPHGFYLGSDGVLRERSGGGVFPLTTQDEGMQVTSFQLAYFDQAGRELVPLPLDADRRAQVNRVRAQVTFRFAGLRPAERHLVVEEHVTLRLAQRE